MNAPDARQLLHPLKLEAAMVGALEVSHQVLSVGKK
jgi:hypothetical protein